MDYKWKMAFLQQYIYKRIICISDICIQSVSKLRVLKNPVDEISPYKIVINYNNKIHVFMLLNQTILFEINAYSYL